MFDWRPFSARAIAPGKVLMKLYYWFTMLVASTLVITNAKTRHALIVSVSHSPQIKDGHRLILLCSQIETRD